MVPPTHPCLSVGNRRVTSAKDIPESLQKSGLLFHGPVSMAIPICIFENNRKSN